MAAEFLKAKLLPETLKTWINTSLGESWEENGDSVAEGSLLARRENWGELCPNGVLVITAGVDVQDDRLELEIVGWGLKEESWSLDYKVIYGDPAREEIWQDLDAILEKPIKHAYGINMRIATVCVDSGGHHTGSVYSYCKKRQLRRIFAVKGSSISGKALVNRPSIANKMRVKLFSIGTDTAKEMIYSRLKIETIGSGYCHFPANRDDEYFKQLTAEKLVTRYHKGYPVRKWEKPAGRRNEALDCRVYALAALGILAPDLETLSNQMEKNYKMSKSEQEEQQQNSVRSWKINSFYNSKPRTSGFVRNW
jgi:phage terminase large subunit GpA-like protein